MNTINDLFDLFRNELKCIVVTLGISEDMEFDITTPSNPDFGDLSTNIALKLTSHLKKPLMDVADIILNKLDTKKLGIAKVEIKKPGFMNFHLEDRWILKIGEMVLNKGIDIITKEKTEKIFLNYPKTDYSNLRIHGYINVLANALKLKGYHVETKEETIDNLFKNGTNTKNITIFPQNHKDSSSKNIPNEVIIVGDMTIFEGENNINSNIYNLLFYNEIGFWAASKKYNKEIKINLKTAYMEDTTNPFFFVRYVETRTSNIISILENEGYDPIEVYNIDNIRITRDARHLIFKILNLENVIEEMVKCREPFKLFEYIYGLSEIFHQYNRKLLFRTMDRDDIVTNMFILKVVNIFYSRIMGLLNIKN